MRSTSSTVDEVASVQTFLFISGRKAMEVIFSTLVAIALFLGLGAIFGSFFTVQTAQIAVVTRFGRFLRCANAGLNWKVPFIDKVDGRMSLRVNQIALTMETK